MVIHVIDGFEKFAICVKGLGVIIWKIESSDGLGLGEEVLAGLEDVWGGDVEFGGFHFWGSLWSYSRLKIILKLKGK